MTRRNVHRSTPGNERAILDAVLSLAVSAGYEGTTMAEVARVSGLPIGSVYWHFESKEKLFAALIDHCFEQWKSNHSLPSNRDVLRRSIGTSAARSADPASTQEAFWVIALLFALEKRLEDNLARRRYLEIREEMFEEMVATVEPTLPPEALAVEPQLARKIVILGRALTDGFYIAAAAGDEIDFAECAELAATAMEALVERYVVAAAPEPDLSATGRAGSAG